MDADDISMPDRRREQMLKVERVCVTEKVHQAHGGDTLFVVLDGYVISQKVEQQKRLATPPYSSNDFYHTAVLPVNEVLYVCVALNYHIVIQNFGYTVDQILNAKLVITIELAKPSLAEVCFFNIFPQNMGRNEDCVKS